ncbi:enoyl-CoA hydratase/isomerase family protein [Streptomyces sp. NPDC051018]|uniref:enoyl-CoA hydratase/isomerase family protein n=1 Tax=Streptomyces sp. NPDC051018 TaxID=3365639 RepID=UPI0037AFBDA5
MNHVRACPVPRERGHRHHHPEPPHRRNAINPALGDALLDALERAESDDEVRAVVLTGSGGNFCVGAEQSARANDHERALTKASTTSSRTLLLRFTRLVHFMYEMNTPTVAEIRGGCAGAGMSLALGCDFRYASTDTVMSTAFLKVAFSGDLGMSWLLTRVVGPARARELLLLSPKVRGDELLGWGLVNGVSAPDELGDRVRATARTIADSAPVAMRSARQNLQAALTLSLGDYLPVEGDRLMACAQAKDDVEEALKAFVEKRPPNFFSADR